MNWIKENISLGIKSWDSFWFKPIDPVSVSCFRFVFCLTLLGMYLIRFFDIRTFFYESGLLSSSGARALHKIHTDQVFSFILSSDGLLYVGYLLFLLLLLLMALGMANRLLAAIAFVLHLVFLQRNPSIAFGADLIATFWLFYLMLSQSHKQVKWLNYFLHKRKGLVSERVEKADGLNTVAFRFIQIQLCIIYMFSGLEKLRGASWWEGTAIWEALSFYDFTFIDFSFLLSLPLLSAVIVSFTVLFEIYFPVLVWLPKIRTPLLIAGVLLHLGIAICLNIYFFSFIMLSAYVVFISPTTLRKFLNKL